MVDAIPRLAAALSGRYTIERAIGAGGMATVYLARDLKHDRKVAIKVLKPELATVIGGARFLAEIRTTANLQHPHILALHDSGEADGSVFYVMPFVDGESLRDRLTREQQLPIDDALRIATEVADALQYSHEHGVIHRDIKPENILLHGGHALVADFGIALAPSTTAGTRMTEAGISLGTPTYMSPEQATGERMLDARTDVYALGCVLYEMLCGNPPFVGSSAQAIVAKVLTGKPHGIISQRDRVPEHVEAAVLMALERHPADRFVSAREFAVALQDRALTRHSKVVRGRLDGVRPTGWAKIAVGALVLGVAGAVWVARRPPAPGDLPVAAPAAPEVSVLIGGVQNRTGDATFDALLPELLATTLEQSHRVSVYPRSNLGFGLRRMQRDANTPIDEAIGREISVREGLAAVVLQSITKLGSSFVLVVRAVLPDGRLMASMQESLSDLSELPARMDAVGSTLRKAFGESTAALARTSVPLDQVTSRSLEAVQVYSQGRQRVYAGDPRGAIVFLRRAVEMDPEFAMAHGALGVAYTNVLDMATAVHDRRQRNTVLSISWGLAEVHWHRSILLAFNRVLLEAAVLGITVCCSSGDYGSFADAHDRQARVNFPGSSPYVLSCGGTTLVGTRTRIQSERVWHNHRGASGGGVSAIFPRPHWQRGLRVPRTASGYLGRGLPDVASNADPLTGYRIFGHGQWHVGAGTSAASPLWAGLVARINQRCGTAIGLPTPHLYQQFAELVRAGAVVPVTKGSNGLYRARKGWSCCTGVGSPRGAKLARAFSSLQGGLP